MTDRSLGTATDLNALSYDENGRVPVVAQDSETGDVLMVAWATREALDRTLETGSMHFWSRSRNELWHKGATSGNTQALVSLHADCDGDTVLARVRPAGPACHTGEGTCFGDVATDGSGRSGASSGSGDRSKDPEDAPPHLAPADDTLRALWAVLESRAGSDPEGSYTARLLGDENLRIKKLGEETAELILALTRGSAPEMAEEAADLLYHTLVALLAAGGRLDDVLAVLARRRNRGSGTG